MSYELIDNIEKDGLRIIKISDNQYNLIDKNDNLILKQNYYDIGGVEIDGLRIIKISENEYNLIDKNGNHIFKNNKNSISWVSWDENDSDREIDGKIWNYKTYLKQKLIKKILYENR